MAQPQGPLVRSHLAWTYCIAQIRTALGDSDDNPRFVQTVHLTRVDPRRARSHPQRGRQLTDLKTVTAKRA
jgi:hypothetical protein